MSLPQILKAEEGASAPSGNKLPHKAVIMIYLSGGPSHQDMYDLKMDAPVEIRGSFKPIHTNVPGIEICEHMPRLAQMMDKFAIIRSLYGSPDQHASDTCLSGFPIGARAPGQSAVTGVCGVSAARGRGSRDPAVCRTDDKDRSRTLFESGTARVSWFSLRSVSARKRRHGQHAAEQYYA